MSTTTNRTIEIAQTVLEQIKALDGWALAAYGATNFAAVSAKDGYLGGISFMVNGLKHSGWVTIKLTVMDEYEISFINRNREVVKVVEGVHFPELIQVLNWVEKG